MNTSEEIISSPFIYSGYQPGGLYYFTTGINTFAN